MRAATTALTCREAGSVEERGHGEQIATQRFTKRVTRPRLTRRPANGKKSDARQYAKL